MDTRTAREHTRPDCPGLNDPGAYETFTNERDFRKHRCTVCGAESYGTPRRLNTAEVRYNRDDLLAAIQLYSNHFTEPLLADWIADSYEKARIEGPDKPCQSLVYHGPGHQSSAYCEARGNHDIADSRSYPDAPSGAMIHHASLPSGGWAEWTDDDPYDRSYY